MKKLSQLLAQDSVRLGVKSGLTWQKDMIIELNILVEFMEDDKASNAVKESQHVTLLAWNSALFLWLCRVFPGCHIFMRVINSKRS